jgi:hypothetical protein
MNSTARLYSIGIVGVAAVLIVGFIIVRQHTPVVPSGQVGSWGTNTNFISYSATRNTSSTQETRSALPDSQNLQSFSYNPSAPASITEHIINSDSSFDFSSFMQRLSTASHTSTYNQSFQIPEYTYDSTPILTPPESSASARTDIQQALYVYGNIAGAFIKNYEQANPHDAATVQTYFNNRTNPAGITALKHLAADLGAIGTNLKNITNIPAPIAAAHTALADSYIDMGAKLAVLPEAHSNSDMIKAILTYDSAVDTYVQAYNALARIFETYGVSFETADSGSVFTFTNIGGL